MRILHIDEQRAWRGGEQQASYLIRGLAALGHTCVIAGRPEGAFLKADHGVAAMVRVPAPFRGELDIATAWTLAQAVRRHAIDVLHAHSSHAHTMACLARTIARRGKVVVHRRVDFAPKRHLLNRIKYALPDRFIAVCQRVAEVLYEFGVPRRKVSVAYSSIDLQRFDVKPLDRTQLGIPEDAPLLGNVAALAGHKDHANLLDAMPLVLREIPGLRLVIAGEGERRGDIEARIARLGLSSCVTLLGHRDDVPRLLQTLDAFVLSSYAEGIGGAAIEALACGRPVVATDAGGVGEIVQNEQTGLLVPARNAQALANAIVRIFRDRALAARLAANGRALVADRFTVDTMIDKTVRVYEDVLASQ